MFVGLSPDISLLGQEKNMCGSGYPTYPYFLAPTLNLFLPILKLKGNSRTKYFWSAFPFHLQNLAKKIYISKYHLKWKSFLCIQSLILEMKGLQQGYIFKTRPFYISFVLFHLPSSAPSLDWPSKNIHKSFIPTNIFIFLKTPKNIEIQNVEPKTMAEPTYIWKY